MRAIGNFIRRILPLVMVLGFGILVGYGIGEEKAQEEARQALNLQQKREQQQYQAGYEAGLKKAIEAISSLTKQGQAGVDIPSRRLTPTTIAQDE